METKEINGTEYIEKSDVDELIRSRLAKMSERARNLQSEKDELAAQIESSKGASERLEGMAAQIQSLQAELEISNTRYDLHSTIASHGITDPDLRDMVEWQWKQKMGTLPKKERIGMGEWLKSIQDNPENAPITLRPFLIKEGDPKSDSPPKEQSVSKPHPHSGAVNPPSEMGERDLMERARDPQFYSKNRDKIREAWYRQQGIPAPWRF